MNNPQTNKPRRGIYLLPNLFTTSALFAGFYSIIAALEGRFEAAAIATLAAALLDGLDGRVARMTNTSSAFGAEYDSMSDMVSFGVAPAMVVYLWSLQYTGDYGLKQLGWVIAFLYTACAGLRLARFNVAVGTADKRFFQGLASPSAAILVVSFVWMNVDVAQEGRDTVWLSLLVTAISGLLMVSNFAYYSGKDFGATSRLPFFAALIVVLVFVFISLHPPMAVLLLVSLYAVSGPALSGWRILRRRNRKAE